MIILAVDTSSSQGSLCLFDHSKVLSHQQWTKQGSHSELITKKLQTALKESNKSIEDIKKIYCGIGPGSFTGIRVGVSFCKSIAFAKSLPIAPLNSLISLAISTQAEGSIVSLVDAQKNTFFFSHCEVQSGSIKILKENKLLPIDQLKNFITEKSICCGDGYPRYENFLDSSIKEKLSFDDRNKFIDLSQVIPWDLKNSLFKETEWKEFQPLYIRPSSAEEKLRENKG